MDTMPVGFVQSLLYLDKGNDVAVSFKANSLVYDARNLLSLYAIEENFDRVMWFDSDMMFTKDTMRMLHADMDALDADMVTGVYFKRRIPIIPVIYDRLDEPRLDEDGKPIPRVHEFIDYPKDAVFQVKGCGFGVVMMTTKLLKHVWDKFGPAFSPYPWASEDISFCHRVNQLGYPIWCDSNIVAGHIGTMVYTEEHFNKRGDKI